MKKRTLLSFIVLFSLIALPGILATSAEINVAPSFTVGNAVSFNYSVVSNANENISYVATVRCPTAPDPLAELTNINLSANIPFSGTYMYISNLTNNIDPQKCNAFLWIVSPDNITISKSFLIVTLPSFNIKLSACQDQCARASKFFVTGSTVQTKYNSSVQNPTINFTLTKPDNSTSKISVPGNFTVNETGKYSITAHASKEGYKPAEDQIYFYVISQEPKIGYTSLAAEKKQQPPEEHGPQIIYVIILLIMIVLGILTALILAKKKKRK